MKTYEIVDSLQSVREQIASLQEREKLLAGALKKRGLGTYEGSISDCLVQEVDVSRVNVDKLIKRLSIPLHTFNKFYTVAQTQVRAKIINKRISAKKAA